MSELLEIHKKQIETIGFWQEDHKSFIKKAIELCYKKEIVRQYMVSDFVVNGNKVLIKWDERLQPLSDIELKEKYGI